MDDSTLVEETSSRENTEPGYTCTTSFGKNITLQAKTLDFSKLCGYTLFRFVVV
jgi:hypothetical protein